MRWVDQATRLLCQSETGRLGEPLVHLRVHVYSSTGLRVIDPVADIGPHFGFIHHYDFEIRVQLHDVNVVFTVCGTDGAGHVAQEELLSRISSFVQALVDELHRPPIASIEVGERVY